MHRANEGEREGYIIYKESKRQRRKERARWRVRDPNNLWDIAELTFLKIVGMANICKRVKIVLRYVYDIN